MDTFDYHRSSVPARMPSHRGSPMTLQRYEAGSAENAPSPISVRAVFRATRRYWWLILALWTVGSAGIGAAVYLKVRPQYRALSLLRVDPTAIDLYIGGSREGGEPYMRTNVELIKSPNVLQAAAQAEKVRDLPRIRNSADPQLEINNNVFVYIRPDTQLIEVSMVSPSGEEAAIIVNAVVDEFLSNNKLWSSGSRRTQIEKLTAHYKNLLTDLQLNESRMRERLKTSETVTRQTSPDDLAIAQGKASEEKLSLDQFSRLTSRYQDAKMGLMEAEAKLEQVRKEAEEAARDPHSSMAQRSTASFQRMLRQDPDWIRISQEIQSAQSRLDGTQKVARNANDPAAERHKQTLRQLNARMRDLVERRRLDFQEDTSNPANLDPNAQVKLAEADVNKMKALRDGYEKELAAFKQDNMKHEGDKFDLRLLNEEHAVLREKAEIVDRRLSQLKFDEESDGRIRKVNDAVADRKPTVDKRLTLMAAAPVGVLAAVLALVILLEIRSGRVADTEVLSSRMRHEVFAIAPLPSARQGLGLMGDRTEQDLARFVQSLDHLRVALCEGGTQGEGRCVMITSATGGEGKTTLSAHLAARCANAGTSTLLIDGDLRRASLGRLLDVPAGMGLGDVLAGTVELAPELLSVQAGGFHFLSAGTPGIDPTRVLKSTRLAELIGQLRQMYDLIIIDTPPVLPVADALIVGRWADGAVMAARYDASRLPLVERANRQIVSAGIPVLGVVVNGVKGQDQTYGNYSYSYSYPGRQEPLNNPADVS